MERIELITSREYWVEMIEHTTKKGFTDIELADTIVNKMKEALTTQRVSQQRKLLIAYEIEASKPYNASEEMVKPKVDRIMKAINCG